MRERAEACPPGTWVVVDEIQRRPSLLNEVQSLISLHPDKYRFALTGSSARKLRREGANLLPGRAVNRAFFPLVAAEAGLHVPAEEVLRFGCLPAVRSAGTDRDRIDLLDAYAANYLAQEVRLDATVKNLPAFSRFLEVASIANGQVTNVAGIARDAGVARPTVSGYFDTLVDTLIGVWLPAWTPRAKVKEVRHPKFYFFDPGVVRALTGRLREPLDSAEKGALLETYVLHELRAHLATSGIGGDLSYWRTPSGTEVDFVWSRAGRAVAIEVKSATRWRPEYSTGLDSLLEAGHVRCGFGIYLGDAPLRRGAIDVLPLRGFLERLYAGDIIG